MHDIIAGENARSRRHRAISDYSLEPELSFKLVSREGALLGTLLSIGGQDSQVTGLQLVHTRADFHVPGPIYWRLSPFEVCEILVEGTKALIDR